MKVLRVALAPLWSPTSRRRLLFILSMCAVFLGAASVRGQTTSNALSKEKIIALRKAGVSDPVLIQQIQKDGVSFDMNADTTLELKNVGLSNDVLQVLLQASSKPPSSSAQPAKNDSVAGLYQAGRFPELADRLRASLKANPSDYRTDALLIMTLLKMKEKDAARTEFQQLAAHDQDPAAAPLVKQVKALFDSLAKTEEAKGKLIAALKDYRVADAMAALDELPASANQREILKINLDMYQGKYDEARDRFSKIPFGSYSEKEHLAKTLDHITETEAAYKKLMARVDVYLYSPFAPVFCSFPIDSDPVHYPEVASMSAKEFIGLANKLIQIAPLSDDVRNLGFHAQLLAGNYDDLERWGDSLLKNRGNIRIAFFASDRFFRLIIDARRKRIYTEQDSHPFEPRYPKGSRFWADLVPFDLPFDQIKGLSQKGWSSHDFKKPYAVKFAPDGVAPNFALMNILNCTAGEKAGVTATRNLGQYILHVIARNDVRADLADPAKLKGPSSGLLTGLLIAGASMSSNPALSTAAVQGLQADQSQQIATYQAQQAAWESFDDSDAFRFVEADVFSGLEELLGVLN